MSLRLIDLVERLPACRVCLVGDFMLDRYLFGNTDRISPEAPIPVLRFRKREQRLGGAGFVAAGLATLGATVDAIGTCGDDLAGREMRDLLRTLGAGVDGIVTLPDRPTIEKTRLLGSSEDRTYQQMIRLDIEDAGPVDDDTGHAIIERARASLATCDLLCLEDYNKGVLSDFVCRSLIDLATSMNKPVLIDPARVNDYGKYAGATMIKLNRPETERATGIHIGSIDDCPRAAERLLERLRLEAVVITLNDKGSYLATRDGARELLTSRARQVADPTGAGDMVLVTLAMAHAAGASWHEAVALSNVVGGLEVERLGCVPITRDEIIHDLLNEHRMEQGKERDRTTLAEELKRHRAAGRRIVFTNGCFDIVHLGHVKYFQWAKAQGDVLVVGVNTDDSIRRLKGPKRPVIHEDDRVGVLEELESIDYLVRFDDDTPIELIHAVKPDVLVKGADYAKEQVVGWDFVEGYGGVIALAPLIEGRSTSTVIQRILEAYQQ